MKAIIDAYRKAFQFEGRTSVREYLYFHVFTAVVGALIVAFEADTRFRDGELEPGATMILFFILNFLPCLTVAFRRLHDAGLRGTWWLINFVPIIGPVLLLILCLLPGTKGENRFGPPLGKADSKGVEAQSEKSAGNCT